MKKESFFKAIFNKVSKLSWVKGVVPAAHQNMKPGKGFNQPVSDHAFDYLKELDDAEFKKLIAILFKQRGYTIVETEESNDSVDITLKMNGAKTFVQYKHWREYEIDIAELEKFDAVMEEESVREGIMITTGLFTQEALDYSHAKHLLLINGVDLSLMVNTMGESNEEDSDTKDSSHTQNGHTEESNDSPAEEMPELEPLCPICSREMIKRTARKGKNAGNTFWGCSQFPNCRGVISN